MPFIISAGTFVSGFGSNTGGVGTQIGTGDRGIQSVSLSTNVTPNRLWHLGYITPYDENVTIQKQLSITCYGGGASNVYDTEASQTCIEPSPLSISINANACDGSSFVDLTDWWLTSYSYNKDMQGWGSESWSFISKPIILNENLQEITDVNIIMVRGIAEGEQTTDGGADTGIVFIAGTQILDKDTINALDFVGTVEVTQGSPGIGRANDMEYGVVGQVGENSTGKSDGRDARGSVNIPYTPIFQ